MPEATLAPAVCLPGTTFTASPVSCVAGTGVIVPTDCFVAVPVNDVDLFVTKTYVGPTPLLFGDDGNFRVVVGNNGPELAVSAVITDTVPFANASTVNDPVNIAYAGGASGPSSVSWADLAAGLLVINAIPVGGTVTLDGSMSFYGPAQQVNNVSVAADPSQNDTNPANNSATASVSAVAPQADVRVVKTISAPAFVVGDPGTITIVATNAGPQSDPSVSIFDNIGVGLGPFLTFAPPFNISYTGGATGPATVAGSPVSFTANMPIGSTVTVVMPFVAAADSSGARPNTAQVTTSILDGNPGNNTSTITATVSTAPTCCINIENIVVSPNPVPAGAAFTLTADYRNCGTQALGAGSATLSGLPAGVITTFPGATVTWAGIPTVGFVTRTHNLENNSATAQNFTATITASSPCAIGSATDVDTTPISVLTGRVVEITTNKSGADPAVGVANTFTNTHTNVGPDAADGLTVIDVPGAGYDSRWTISAVLPISVTYAGGASGPGSVTRAQLFAGFTVTTWPVGGQVIVNYSVIGVNNVPGSNENCAGVRAIPNVTLVNTTDFCFPFTINGTSNCSCQSDLNITPTDIFLGNPFTVSYALQVSANCCDTVDFRVIQYPTFADATADTNGVESVLGTGPCATFGGSGSFNFTPPAVGFYRYYLKVINNGLPQPQECNITDTDQVFGNAPLPSRASVIAAGNWAVHNVS